MGEATWGGGDEPTVRLSPPVDPWPDAHDGLTQPIPITRKRVYGRIYELNLRNPRPDEQHPYVGKTEQTIHQRVHGRGGHTSPASVAKDPWKARILPGRAGYRELAKVYATGDDRHDEAILRSLEAFWIDKLKTRYNDVRPVRPFVTDIPAPRGKRSTAAPARRRPARKPLRAGDRMRVISFLFVVALFTFLAARVILAMSLPWPAAPWVASPIVGTLVGWAVFWRLTRSVRRLVRGR